MGLNISQFAKWLIDRARDMGVKLTIDSSALAKWAADNPAAAAAMLKTAGSIIHGVKATDFAGLMQAIGQARMDGASMKQILGGLSKGAWKGAGGLKSLGIGAVKLAGLAVAAALAKETVKHAGKAWNAQTSDIAEGWKEGNPGKVAKNVWELAWETSIPVATFRQLQSFGRWITGNGKKAQEAAVQGSGGAGRSGQTRAMKEAQLKAQLDNMHPMAKQGYNVNTYERVAKKNNLVEAPANPQAYNEWRKKVESVNKMKKDTPLKTATNHVDWYFKGNAAALLGTDLTWTAPKEFVSFRNKFALTVANRVACFIPIEGGKLHPQIKDNIEAIYIGLRGKNTGAYQYDSEDVYNYIVGLYSMIARWRYLAKLIAITGTRDVLVRDLPKRMLRAIFDQNTSDALYTDIISQKPNYVEQLNTLAMELNQWALPGMTLMSRWNYIADKALVDYRGPKPVYGVYAISKIVGYAGSGHVYEFPRTLNALQSEITALENEMSSFKVSTSHLTSAAGVMGKVSGDMIKLLGASGNTFNNCPFLKGDEAIKYEYDEEAVDQLRSAKILPISANVCAYPDYSGVNVPIYRTQVSNGTHADLTKLSEFNNAPSFTISNRSGLMGKSNIQLIQFKHEVQLPTTYAAGQATTAVTITDCSATVLETVNVRYTDSATADANAILGSYINFDALSSDCISIGGVSTAYTTTFQYIVSVLKQVDFLPALPIYMNYSGSGYFTETGLFVDIDNYAMCSHDQFVALNNVAAYSLSYFMEPKELKIMSLL